MALSANNGSERARQLIILTRRLSERLDHETALLRAHRPQDLFDGIEETRALSNLYRHESARVKADIGLLSGMTPQEQKDLREATSAFQTRLQSYEQAVNAAKTITEGIISAVAADLSAMRAQNMTYGPRAKTIVQGPQSLNFGHKA